MGKTKKNLEEAFAGESQANRKYLAYAKQAEEEGYPKMAKLFRAIADSETVHALSHLQVMGLVDSTKSNIKEAIEGEKHEVEVMYPEFVKEAEKEENERAIRTFSHALSVEKIHRQLLRESWKMVNEDKDIEDSVMTVCQVCGSTFRGDVPDICPICATPKDEFKEIK